MEGLYVKASIGWSLPGGIIYLIQESGWGQVTDTCLSSPQLIAAVGKVPDPT